MSALAITLKLDDRSSYLTTFVCQFDRKRYKRLLFGETPAGDMLKHKIYEIFRDLPNVFGTVDGILVAGYDIDGKDHDKTLWWVLQICRNVNLKLNKDKFHFRCTSAPFFGEVFSRLEVQPNPRKLKVLTNMLQTKKTRSCRHPMVFVNYLGEFSPRTAEVCESLRKMTLAKVEWTWNATYQICLRMQKQLSKRMHA